VAEKRKPRSRRAAAGPGGAEGGAAPPPAPPDEPGDASRCGFIALIGAPNAGKSTLVNTLVGAKVAIVTHKAQTTRALVRGIALVGPAQLVLVDTPGIFAPRRRLDRAMVATAWGGAEDADLTCVLIDAKAGIAAEVEAILARLAELGRPKALIINKIDLVPRPSLLALAADLNARGAFDATFMISALTGDGVDDLKSWLAERAPPGPWHYPADDISDAPLRSLAAEITRESLYRRVHQELPYCSTVETDQWKDLNDGSVRIEQTIYVERESQRRILLGKGGSTIKAIGADARREIARIIEVPVHLFLFIKVRAGWGDDPERYRGMGLEFPGE